MTSLLDTILGHLTHDMIGGAASRLGETEAGVLKAVKGLVPTILAGIAGKADDDRAFGNLFSLLGDRANADFLGGLGGMVGGGNLARNDPKDIAGAFIGNLFGPKVGPILSALSSFAGLKPGSASALLGLAGPLVLGGLGKKIADERLGAADLKRIFTSEADQIRRAVPSELFGMLGLANAGATRMAAPPAAAAAPAAMRGGRALLWAIPAVIGVGLVGWMLTRGAKKEAPAVVAEASLPAPAAPIEALAPDPVIASVQPVAPTEYVRELGGFELRGALDGVEEKLVSFLESDTAPCTEAACWFTFDRLIFATGSAELDMTKSQAQLENIKYILEAYPSVQLKIGGYTDNVGPEDANKTLSQRRAEAVVAALTAIGVDPTRIVAEGYGSQHPVASNDTEEGRAQNRRIDVRVRQR